MIASATLAAGFVNPALLGGLGLFLVPIIIHLLSRRHHRRVEWAAMRFLLEADKENRRRVRFEQWLLLALRCLVMVLLGGLETLSGPWAGALIYKALQILITSFTDFWQLILGAILLALVLAFPEGLVGAALRLLGPAFRPPGSLREEE